MNRTVRDNTDASRYEISEDGQLAGFTEYRVIGEKIALNHTETLEGFTGRGVAGQLIAEVLADARRRNLAVLPFCPVVRQTIARHPEQYLDLVATTDRQRFNLPT